MTSGPTTSSLRAVGDDRALRSAGRLLEAGRDEEAAELLGAFERSHEAAGDAVQAEIFAAARRLCGACRRHREEMDAQNQAARAAVGVARRLRERLSAILDVAATRSLVGPPERAEIQPPTSRSSPETRDVLAVQCLGRFCVLDDDHKLEPWPNRRSKAVFKYLVIHRDRPVLKETLMEAFWPDAGISAARNNLNVAIHALRRFLRDAHGDVSHVVFQDGCYAIDSGLPLWVDAEDFERLAAAGDAHAREGRLPEALLDLHAAEVLYQGGLFDDDPYEEWMLPRRRELQDRYVSVLALLGELYRAADDDRACIEVARKVLAVEPFREAAHRELMRCYARQGQWHLALRQYRDCVDAFRANLDSTPSEEVTDLYERIRAHQAV